jgi:hypothetical protein
MFIAILKNLNKTQNFFEHFSHRIRIVWKRMFFFSVVAGTASIPVPPSAETAVKAIPSFLH